MHRGILGSQQTVPDVQALQLTLLLSPAVHTYCPQKPQGSPGLLLSMRQPPQALLMQTHEPETQVKPLHGLPLSCQAPVALQFWGCWPLHVA
jgi:hypothetical protein